MVLFFGRGRKLISWRLGHSVEKVAIIEAIISEGGSRVNLVNLTLMIVVLGERNEGINGTNVAVASRQTKAFRPGSKGALRVRCCRTERTLGGRGF